MRRYILLIIGTLLFFSCNKTPMKGDLERFVGTWEWYNTFWINTSNQQIESYLASNQQSIFIVKIDSKGRMYWYKDGELIKKINLKITYTNCDIEANCSCSISIEDNSLPDGVFYTSCSGYEDVWLKGIGFPKDVEGNTETNVFRKVE